jgi:hypothetical protein
VEVQKITHAIPMTTHAMPLMSRSVRTKASMRPSRKASHSIKLPMARWTQDKGAHPRSIPDEITAATPWPGPSAPRVLNAGF